MISPINANEIKEQVSLSDFLGRLGHRPSKKSGKELFYLSMLRDTDTSPSFCVNEDLGVWYDHGIGKGGNIIDFALFYWKHLSFKEVLAKIADLYKFEVSSSESLSGSEKKSRKRIARKLPHYKIEEVKKLGNNDAITNYLKSRGIWNVANDKLRELYYFVEDEKKVRKHFFSAGWQNENGGWEVRNKYFKGCLGPKGMSSIQGNESVAVFEGYLNFLSWLFENRDSNASILVLNSLSFLSAAIKRASNFQTVNLYFDNDDSGQRAKAEFLEAVPRAIDSSDAYTNYNDYNDKLMAEIDALCRKTVSAECNNFSKLSTGISR